PPTRHAICLLLCCGLFWLGHFYFLLATEYTLSIFEPNLSHVFFESLFYHAFIATVLCAVAFFATYPLRIEKSSLCARLSRAIPALALPVALIGIYVALIGIYAGMEKITSHRIDIKNLMQFVFLCWGALMFSAALALRTKFQIKWMSASLAFICLVAAIPAVSARDMFFHYHEHQLLSAAKEAGLLDLTGQFKEKLADANIPSETEAKLRRHIEALQLSRSPAASKYLRLLHEPLRGKTQNTPHVRYLSLSKNDGHWLSSNGFDYISRFEPSLPRNNPAPIVSDVNLYTGIRLTRTLSGDGVLQLKLHTAQNGDTIPPLVFNIYEHFLKNVLPMVPTPGGLETDAASKIFAENEYMRAELELISMDYSYRPSGDPKDIIGINSIRSIIRLSLKDAAKQQKETP
ncbi:MAG TPA: hypothetical protein PLW48_02670, partial [Alphaproteobacteria bacterium]|nr:hypothetical protein [Alphaproteobacteria bacterium]